MMKYRDALMATINIHLEAWFDQAEPVPQNEVYRFLHSLKGTSGTIGLSDLSSLSQLLMEQLESRPPKDWTTTELRGFLLELITMSYEYHPGPELLLDDSLHEAEAKNRYENQPLVLILDDDVTLLMFLKEELEKRNWSVIATVHPHKALDYFHDMQPDCLIVDIYIPETDGFQVMKTLSEKIKKQYVPTTVISIDCERETRLTAFRMGADDVMCKPLDVEELAVRLERQLRRKQWIDRMLFVDELTGAFNRNSLTDTYERLLSDAQRTNARFSLAFMDIDHFKRVNDTYGHLIGDEVLTGFASFIQSQARKNDILIRYGGEEFVLLMPRTNMQAGKLVLERLLDGFCAFSFDAPSGPFSLSFSAGVVEVDDPQKPLPYWLEAADTALYAAKKQGRRRIEAAVHAAQEPAKVKLKVAIIDDDAMIRTMLGECVKNCFDSWSHAEIRAFRDGEAFFSDDWYKGPESYLVILDGIMPRMDGLEVLQKIRALPHSERYTVIMLTGRKEEQDIVRALQLGADDYMTKPFSTRELEARIRRLVKRSGNTLATIEWVGG